MGSHNEHNDVLYVQHITAFDLQFLYQPVDRLYSLKHVAVLSERNICLVLTGAVFYFNQISVYF